MESADAALPVRRAIASGMAVGCVFENPARDALSGNERPAALAMESAEKTVGASMNFQGGKFCAAQFF